MKDGISKYMNMPDLTDEEAKKYGAHVGEDGKSLNWWTEEEELAARKEAEEMGERRFGTYESNSKNAPSDTPIEYYKEEDKPSSSERETSYAMSHGGGLVRNEDFTEYRANRARQIARQKAAVEAGARAAQAERERLLATGRYFSDGRGNIKLKKEYRQQAGGSGRRGHWDKNTEHNTYADATKYAIENARRAASVAAYNDFGNESDGFVSALKRQEAEQARKGRMKTQALVDQNEFERVQQEEAKKERDVLDAKGRLAIYDGLVAAYKAIDSKADVHAVYREEMEKGELKDEKGRAIGVGMTSRKRTYANVDGARDYTNGAGQKTKNGFVGIRTIDTINENLRKAGNRKFKITGIIARQGVNALGYNDGEPMFYVQGILADGRSFGKTMTLKDVYTFGMENYEKTGVPTEEAEESVIYALGDVMGTRKKNEEKLMRDPKYREMVAKARRAEAEAKIDEYRAEHPETAVSSSGVEIARINAESRRQAEEGKQRRFERGQALKDDKFAYEVSQDANKEAKDFMSSLSDEDRAAAQKEHADFMAAMKKKYGGKKAGDKEPIKQGDNTGDNSTDNVSWPGYSPERTKELIRRGYRWDDKQKKPVPVKQ